MTRNELRAIRDSISKLSDELFDKMNEEANICRNLDKMSEKYYLGIEKLSRYCDCMSIATDVQIDIMKIIKLLDIYNDFYEP